MSRLTITTNQPRTKLDSPPSQKGLFWYPAFSLPMHLPRQPCSSQPFPEAQVPTAQSWGLVTHGKDPDTSLTDVHLEIQNEGLNGFLVIYFGIKLETRLLYHSPKSIIKLFLHKTPKASEGKIFKAAIPSYLEWNLDPLYVLQLQTEHQTPETAAVYTTGLNQRHGHLT